MQPMHCAYVIGRGPPPLPGIPTSLSLTFDVPHLPELTTKVLYNAARKDPHLVKFLPDLKKNRQSVDLTC